MKFCLNTSHVLINQMALEIWYEWHGGLNTSHVLINLAAIHSTAG